jgi:hypothetical protein
MVDELEYRRAVAEVPKHRSVGALIDLGPFAAEIVDCHGGE